jgi:tetratricopeptide (TPR) repeat protein
VALYQALTGHHPFAGRTAGELAESVHAGRLREWEVRLPGWLKRALARGLRADPEARYPSMDALLADLHRAPRRVGIAAGAAALLALGVAAVLLSSDASPCPSPRASLDGVWDEARRSEIERAFLATKVAYARDAFAAVDEVLGRRTHEWAAMHEEACHATRVRKEQSEELLDLRMACLRRLLSEIKALTQVYLRADAKIVERSAQAALGVTPVATCADVRALRGEPKLPKDPARRERIEAVRGGLAEAKALQSSGKLQEALRTATRSVFAARTLGYRPLEAETLHRLGATQDMTIAAKVRESTLHEALAVSQAAGSDDLTARVALQLLFHVGTRSHRLEEALRWGRFAEGVLERMGGNPQLQARLESHLGTTLNVADQPKEAHQHLARSLEILEKAFGPEHIEVANLLNKLALPLHRMGRLEESLQVHRRAKALWTKLLGPQHPNLAHSYNNMALVLREMGKYDLAAASLQRAVALWEQTLGASSPNVGVVLMNLCTVRQLQGRTDEALAHGRRALAIFEKAEGPEYPGVALTTDALGHTLASRGDMAGARALYARTLAIWEKLKDPTAAESLTDLAEIHLWKRRPAAALPLLERALAIRTQAEADPAELARTQYVLARVLVALERDRPRALDLARRARDGFARAGGGRSKSFDEVRAWLLAQTR